MIFYFYVWLIPRTILPFYHLDLVLQQLQIAKPDAKILFIKIMLNARIKL
jgi:hypothetical protein